MVTAMSHHSPSRCFELHFTDEDTKSLNVLPPSLQTTELRLDICPPDVQSFPFPHPCQLPLPLCPVPLKRCCPRVGWEGAGWYHKGVDLFVFWEERKGEEIGGESLVSQDQSPPTAVGKKHWKLEDLVPQ